MDELGTVLIASSGDREWSVAVAVLTEHYGYRVLEGRSRADALAALANVHIDLVVAEDDGSGDGLGLLSGLRTSNPDIVRVLAVAADAALTHQAMERAVLYQYLRRPLDAGQVGLTVERGLEARELARRHRLLSREFKVAGDASI